ncbi:MAG: Spy/CpxP family protein refolding chaperone [Gammaproteobacteria bacterium]|nr:Spy/CpxP family protein refolding chaperone [Gammaproteobacteria bacterium]MBU1442090.1 Spy/CpxP family protein refolding chaperone [Gammaproteobacteria bacterium]MBU2285737.1 Spy/CpxP family protein refolding chaperone [Gammaproteobacteria bacterium]MBU2410781.1 Spy/CpxP family protein refolding chaperone [Gammaproteobacteria bacterium]
MKHWLKRSLLGLTGAALVVGSLAGCAGQRHGWHNASEQDRADFRARMVERVGSKLDLDAAQKQKLAALTDKIQAQRAALRSGGDPRAEFRSLFQGDKFDQAGARKLLDTKIAAVQSGSPEVIAAMGDFFDSLNATQQQKVREFMSRGRHWGRG